MKRSLLLFVLMSCIIANAYSQATSLTVDCQTPGWLSSMINYGDQLTLENIKVTGFINGTDIQFIYDLNNRSLTGVIDLEDVSIVKGGTLYTNGYPRTVEKDNELPASLFYDQKNRIQKFIYPKTLVKEPSIPFQKSGMVDSLIWTSTNVNYLSISGGVGYSKYVYVPEGVEVIKQIPDGVRIILPESTKEVAGGKDLTIYSHITEPELVKSQTETYYSDIYGGHRNYWAGITNSTFYIPKGSMEKYLHSDFAIMDSYEVVNGNYMRKPNGNVYIEYYDIERTEVTPSMTLYKGDTSNLEVKVYPDANLVSWINYSSSNPNIVSVDSEGNIVANDYGQAEVSATPHVFIDGLETKTGTCVVKVIAHTEGVDMEESLSIHIGEQKELKAYTLPLDFSDNKIMFSSNDPSVANVSDDGIIVGLKRGTCTITATSVDGGYTAECVVTVLQPVEAVTMEKHSASMKVGETENLFAQITPATADNKAVTWSSSDEELATVNTSGEVSALKVGTIWIKAVSEDNPEAKDSCKVTITQPVTGIQLSEASITLSGIGQTAALTAVVTPEDASNKEVRWTSSNEAVCVVSNGTVVAIGEGTSVVIATTVDGGFIATCIVTVAIPTSVSTVDVTEKAPFKIFDINGVERRRLQHGINIIRFNDGTKKKVFVICQ